ncbi:MAG: hypothetical protein NTU80_06300 [Verrucomicrobia bacterium]|nr:hypothetical protein [Verrucomicrobiota bacterium]
MGLSTIGQRADFTPLHRALFARLHRLECDWRYEFPRIHVIRPQDLPGSEPEPATAPAGYDPSAAFAAEQQRAEDDAGHARLQSSLDEAEAAARAEARAQPPPPIVSAYHAVFARWPEGWPP